jgi:hypothetical protein
VIPGTCQKIGDRYTTPYLAKLNCSSDENCIGVFVKSCDGGGNYTDTCTHGIKIDDSHGSCVYKKDKIVGKYHLIFSIQRGSLDIVF